MCVLHSLIISHALDAYLFKLYCYIITLTNRGVKKMNEQEKNNLLIDELKSINKNLSTHNQIMSVFLKFALDSSSYKSKTTDEIKASTEKQNEILRTIHEGNL